MGGRKSNGIDLIFSIAGSTVKAAIKANAMHRREVAAQERAQKAYLRAVERADTQLEKSKKQIYLQQRTIEALEKSNESETLFQYLDLGIIPEILDLKLAVDFDLLKPEFKPPIIYIPDNLKEAIPQPKEELYISSVGRKPFWGFIFSSLNIKWQKKIEDAKNEYLNDLYNYNRLTEERRLKIIELHKEFNEQINIYKSEYDYKCQEIEVYKSKYFAFDEDSVISYVELVLESSNYIVDWEKEYNIAYSKNSKELLIEFRLPDISIVPRKKDYKYVRLLDTIEPKSRRNSYIEECYKSLISSIAIRTIYEILKSDSANAISIISFNGYLIADNPINGREISPTIISVLTTKSEFDKINFVNIVPLRCIKGMSAVISPRPNELVAVKPIREYSMIDKRFVEESDIISTLDTRPNLMDLNPFEFENLVSNLFSEMGLETKQTRSTKDNGVDAIAFDTRPIIGGKLVIQAKRYKNTVGVSAVRDLYGTMLNEGASKGLLVTTSSYGPDAYEFSKDKPIELIDGGGLLYLLKQVGITAKIIMPDVSDY